LGKGAGKTNIQHYLDKYAVSLDKDALNELTQQVKTVGRIKKGNITEEELLLMVGELRKR
jgi:isopropylmalate/homocitrate/citramalate synthase